MNWRGLLKILCQLGIAVLLWLAIVILWAEHVRIR